MSWNSQNLDLVWIVKTWISAPSMSRLSRLTVVLPTARRTLARGKHWNFWVSSPSSATTPAIPPSVAFKDLGNTCTLWLESHKSGTSGCEWSSPLVKTEQSVGGWADQDTEEPTKHSAAGLSCKKSWKRRGDDCTKAKVLSIMFFDFLYIINLFVQPFLPQHRLNQDPSPIPFQLKEQGVGVLYQVICSSFNEKPILNHWFEDKFVQKYVLSLLAETEEENIVQFNLSRFISLHLFPKPGLRDLALSICSISYFPW